MTDILQQIVAAKRGELATRQAAVPLAEVRAAAADRPPARDFAGALRGPRPRGSGAEVRIIAEIKRRSPSKGEFPWHGDVARQVRAYGEGGARAVSVVTDGPFFGGSPELLQQVRAATALPVLQKDFVLEPYQVYAARALGADAVLLIAAILAPALLAELAALAREVGIATLVEVTGEAELAAATAAGAAVVGVNNRDLRTFRTDVAHTLTLLPRFRDDQVAVTESGIHTRADVTRLLAAGVDAFLIGEALMTAADPTAHLRALRGLPLPEAAHGAAG